MKNEIWKDVKEYEGLYKVSTLGRIKSLKFNKEKILKQEKTQDGYLTVRLRKDGNVKHIGVHRLVAQAFIMNLNNLPQVNHKDEIKTNNNVDNLEWCTQQYNMSYGSRTKKISKQVYQYTLNGKFIKKWESITNAQEKLNIRHISECCNGKMLTAGGFVWNYDNIFKPIIYKNNRKEVNQYDLSGNFIKKWFCILDIKRELGFDNRNICACCKHKRKTAYGYIWKYADI